MLHMGAALPGVVRVASSVCVCVVCTHLFGTHTQPHYGSKLPRETTATPVRLGHQHLLGLGLYLAMLQQWEGRISSQHPTVSDQILLDITHDNGLMFNIKLIYLASYWVYVAKLGGGQCCSGSRSEAGAALCLTQPVPVCSNKCTTWDS